ncbi:MAG: DUF1707 domain-containing protein [Actinoallomurus sp.]
MAFNPEIRASDADRDRVAAALREHCAQGRIAVDELSERLDLAYRARTLGDLQKVTSDLPEEDMYELPVPAYRQSTPNRRPSGGVYRAGMRAGWATYVSVNLICVVIWLLTVLAGGPAYPWWIWVAGPWGAVMLAGSLFGPPTKRR